MATPLQFPVQLIEHHVGEHRRQRAALRHTHRRGLYCPVHAHPGFEVAIDQPQQHSVLNVPLEPRHQPIVVDPVEKRFQVNVHHPAPSLSDIRLYLLERLVRRAARPESVARWVKVWLPLLLHHLRNGLLNEPIQHRWNPQ